MGILRKASSTETKKVYLDETNTDYILVRADISKSDFNKIAANMPKQPAEGEQISLPEATDFQKFLFGMFVVGWSLDDTVPTLEDYGALEAAAASAVDEAVAKHFEGILPSSAEGKSPTT